MIHYKEQLLANIESFFADNPDMDQQDLNDLCAKTTVLLYHSPNMTPEDLSDELCVSEYSAERLFRLVKIVQRTLPAKPYG